METPYDDADFRRWAEQYGGTWAQFCQWIADGHEIAPIELGPLEVAALGGVA